MNRKKRVGLGLVLFVMLLLLIPVPAAGAQCPPGDKIYFKGSVKDATATKGSIDNPAKSKSEAKKICKTCPYGADLYKYVNGKYKKVGACVSSGSGTGTGVPLAQAVVMILLGLLALGLLAWGIALRLRLQRLERDG